MPELPEVEVTRRGIAPHLVQHTITGVTVRHKQLRWPIPQYLPKKLVGTHISNIARRGKYLLLECATGKGERTQTNGWLIIHLGMTGTLRILETPQPVGTHDHFDLSVGSVTLRYRDPRRFGAILWHDVKDGDVLSHPLFSKLGVEPLSPAFEGALGGECLFKGSRGRSVAIKQLLLAGHVVVGVGNIYASESLFRAGIHPEKSAGSITKKQAQRLAEVVREVLQEAINQGGSTLRDFVGSDGSAGYFQLNYFVYDRANQTCRVCGTTIRQIAQGQRSTFFCPHCQRKAA